MIYDITKPRKYIDKDGNERTTWEPVGKLIKSREKDSFLVKLNMFDGEFHAFPQKPKEERTKSTKPVDHAMPMDFDDEIPPF